MASPDSIKLADYLFTRLRQLGVQSIFGVPGDYNLRLLDYVVPAGLHWVGNCNELNAAYAADGYARINGLSALITTFGVGELSASNGISGAYCERSPVVHIVGTPPRPHQDSRALMHHTFADGEYKIFATMAKHITAAQTELRDAATAPGRIDWVLQQAIIHSRPVYIELPDDMPSTLVSTENLKTPIKVPSAPSSATEPELVNRILERIYSAKQPAIYVDGESKALKIVDQLDALIKCTQWPTWTSGFGKGLVNEDLPSVYGLYNAGFGEKAEKDYYESADLILTFGPHFSDTNSMFNAAIPRTAAAITFKHDIIQVGDEVYRDSSVSNVLKQVLSALDQSRLVKPSAPGKRVVTLDDIKPSDPIAQKNFYRLVNPLFREGDIVLTETGTASYGGAAFKLPPKSTLFRAVTYLSIGFMLPATLGATLAQHEMNKTTGQKNQSILIIGDGSLQMTAQEISVMIKQKLDIVIIIINNEGYTIERVIHGRKQHYNDIPFWRHTQALSYFGADEEHVKKNTFTAKTCGELQDILKNENVVNGSGVRLIEVAMEREDVEGPLLMVLNKQIAEEKQQSA
ncbi:Thiamine pyrophosphate enzyme C-terminal TPP-binding [Penicillium chermesinum]|uniref:Pyruvate decarboxylase n=1 Tax=Penicillium chermesinum TaxID=63820 RepID=A0A9W9P5I6_9EURO|nr:Thiamine pyrophosphate enzyme C-terminal TPP-binding [Penicillium chermesinum]KAJ5238306.1 Thiamine pyrophosphate enzyme C-terminal TPP-binding [Penicillium chermesinum]KAJ6163973.1 Thiamine pyrophosphate enzyme C-terminal TPP-binding [Penicillium chermesinum]